MNYSEWLTFTCGGYYKLQMYQRFGQYLYNSLPDRFMGKVPHAIDPFYNDSHVSDFLAWLERNWDES